MAHEFAPLLTVSNQPASIHTHTLAEQLGDAVAEHLGHPVTSGLRFLLLAVVQGHIGKVIEGQEQI